MCANKRIYVSLSGSLRLGGQRIAEWRFADWSCAASVDAELAIAKPFTTSSGTSFDLDNRGELAGKVVLMGRGTASLQARARAAQDAGAVGVIFANNDKAKPDAADELIVNDLRDELTVDIPVVMVSFNSGDRAMALGPGTSVAFTGPSCGHCSVVSHLMRGRCSYRR